MDSILYSNSTKQLKSLRMLCAGIRWMLPDGKKTMGRKRHQKKPSKKGILMYLCSPSFGHFLVDEKILKSGFDVTNMKIGDFIEIEGELQKNPLINYMDIFVDLFRMADIFAEKPQLGGKTQAKAQKQQENETVKQIRSFADELKHSGTIDFILSDTAGTVVLSAQEQYLSNDNISEIIGGHFKVLGKVIAICKDETENIDLLRKTTLSILPIDLLTEPFSEFQNDDTKQFNLPELKTQISGPAVIVIPVAIYA